MRHLVLPLATLGVLASCAELFDEPSQCKTDADCARFEGAICDVASGVCVRAEDKEDDAGNSLPDVITIPTDAPAETTLPDLCNVSPKPTGVVGTKIDGSTRAEITGAVTLGCDKDWTLDGVVFVRSGATLTVQPGTTIRAKKGMGAAIIVSPGAKIIADGKRDAPIVITSDATLPASGDWRGIFVLGLAPPAAQGPYDDDPDLAWGGANDQDDSGVLSFVRIEYATNGLVLAGAGKKTRVDSVEVRRTVKSCIVFYGGTVDAKHLICQSPGSNQFEWYLDYKGRAQFLFGQHTAPPPAYGANGLLIDDAKPVLYNATLCGTTPTPNGYGVVFRDSATLDLNGAIVTGWFAGIDGTGALPVPGAVKSSIFFGNATNPAYNENVTSDPDLPAFDDDNGFDEVAWIGLAARNNAFTNPMLVGCFDLKSPKPWPQASLTTKAPTPPNDGFFDTNAKYVGAFANASDPWMTGAWVRFDDK